MAYLVLARKWRPQTFDEIVGQEHVTITLKRSIIQGRIGHAYLFTGIRGVGKTSVARILAKALNCEQGPTPDPCNKCRPCTEITLGASIDVQEIDGASNRGIDNVRELREGVAFAPARDRYKVYIIDEVHMLTQEAFNALLKTLEEPPSHVVFIFATTEAHKVPATIASRCQVFDFKRIPLPMLVDRLRLIANSEGIEASEDAIRLIAREADGSLRDACSILDQVASFCEGRLDVQDVAQVLQTGDMAAAKQALSALLNHDAAEAMRLFMNSLRAGVSPKHFLRTVARALSDVIKVVVLGNEAVLELGLTKGEIEDYQLMAGAHPLEYLAALLSGLVTAADQAAESRFPELVAQAAIIRAAEMRSLVEIKDIIERLEALASKDAAQGTGKVVTMQLPDGPPTIRQAASSPPVAPSKPKISHTGARPTPHGHGETTQAANPKQSPPKAVKSTQEAEATLLSRFRKHPVVDKVLEYFGGEVIEVREEG